MKLSSRLVLLSLMLLAGCSHYWTRAGSSSIDFATDHQACMEANSVPVVGRPGYGVTDEQAFRRCLIARGWTRRQALSADVPAGYYRGYEEREVEPVRLDALPEQPAAAAINRLNRCRTLYDDPRLRKICAERDAGTR
jgi:hypothetical protein